MVRCCLVQASYNLLREGSKGSWGITPNLGLAYVAAVLEENSIEVDIYDANLLNSSPQDVVDHAVQTQADILGVSLMTPAHNFSVSIAQKLPESILSVAGGAHATALPETMLDEGFDVVVRGEGEYSMLEIAKGKILSSIKGISYKTKDGKIHHNPDRTWLDPNKLPLPSRHLFKNNGVDKPYFNSGTRYFPWARIVTTRGCPYSCYYCNKLIFGHQIRPRTPENVFEEIRELVEKYGVKEFNISDDFFNYDLERAEKIFDLIISSGMKIKIRFPNGLRADKITERFLDKAKKAGCFYLAFGIESGDQRILDSIPKNIKLDTIRKAVKLTKRKGITVTGYFMLGLLGDTEESMQRTIDFAKELDLDIYSFSMATPYPGTRMWDLIEEGGGEILIDNWDEYTHTSRKTFFTMPGMVTPETIKKMYKRAYRQCYFRPKYILKKIPKLLSPREIKVMINGIKPLIYTQQITD